MDPNPTKQRYLGKEDDVISVFMSHLEKFVGIKGRKKIILVWVMNRMPQHQLQET